MTDTKLVIVDAIHLLFYIMKAYYSTRPCATNYTQVFTSSTSFYNGLDYIVHSLKLTRNPRGIESCWRHNLKCTR